MKKIAYLSLMISSFAFAEELPPTEQAASEEIQAFFPATEEKAASVVWDEITPKAAKQAEQVPTAAPTEVVQIPEQTLNTPFPPAPPPPESPVATVKVEEPAQEVAAAAPIVEQDLDALDEEDEAVPGRLPGILIDFKQVFAGSPTIYSTLLFLSIASLGLGLYSLLSLRSSQLVPQTPLTEVKNLILAGEYEAAKAVCEKRSDILFKMVQSGLAVREWGPNVVLDTMKTEGKRASGSFWQRLALLNDIAIIAPMLGLLGTVLGMFYAFYDLNRSVESITALFDGLGISVGTTVAGIVVAIIAMVLHSMTKYRLTRQLALVENEANSLARLMDARN